MIPIQNVHRICREATFSDMGGLTTMSTRPNLRPFDSIITGDCLDVLPTLPAQSVNLVFTSPPYPGQMGNGQSVGEWLDWLACVLMPRGPAT